VEPQLVRLALQDLGYSTRGRRLVERCEDVLELLGVIFDFGVHQPAPSLFTRTYTPTNMGLAQRKQLQNNILNTRTTPFVKNNKQDSKKSK